MTKWVSEVDLDVTCIPLMAIECSMYKKGGHCIIQLSLGARPFLREGNMKGERSNIPCALGM